VPFATRPSTRSILARALLLGIAAGLRSMTPLAALARQQQAAPRSAGWTRWPLLRSRAGRAVLQAAWLGELVVDKLPGIPPRIHPGPLGGRIMIGMLAGLAAGSERHGAGAKVAGAVTGGLGAIVGAYGGYHVRTLVTETTDLPDTPVALVGDAAAAALARAGARG